MLDFFRTVCSKYACRGIFYISERKKGGAHQWMDFSKGTTVPLYGSYYYYVSAATDSEGKAATADSTESGSSSCCCAYAETEAVFVTATKKYCKAESET